MKVRDIMTQPAIHVAPGESVEVAARTLTQYNIGALPVCNSDGKLCGMVSLGDLTKTPSDTADTLGKISSNIRP